MISKRDTSNRFAPLGITDHFTMRLRLRGTEEEIMIFLLAEFRDWSGAKIEGMRVEFKVIYFLEEMTFK